MRQAGELSSSLTDDLEHRLDSFLKVNADVSEFLTTNVATMINEAMDLVAMMLVEIIATAAKPGKSLGALDRVNIVKGTFKAKGNRSILVIMGNVCLAVEGDRAVSSDEARVGDIIGIWKVTFNKKVGNVGQGRGPVTMDSVVLRGGEGANIR